MQNLVPRWSWPGRECGQEPHKEHSAIQDNSWSAASKPHLLLNLVSCDQLLQCGLGNFLLLSQLLLLLLNLLQCRPSQDEGTGRLSLHKAPQEVSCPPQIQ